VLKSSENDNGNLSSMAFILVGSDYQISCQMTLKSFNKHLSKALKSYKDPFQQHALDCNIISYYVQLLARVATFMAIVIHE
jgi:hypothetical protein